MGEGLFRQFINPSQKVEGLCILICSRLQRKPKPYFLILCDCGGDLLAGAPPVIVRVEEAASTETAMAGEGDVRASGKKSDAEDDLPLLNAENLQANMKSIYYSRTFLSIVGGVVAGISGLTGLTGFVLYFIVMAFASLGLAAKAKFSVNTYFDSWNRILLDGIFGGLMSFVLFWAFAYDIVHIF